MWRGWKLHRLRGNQAAQPTRVVYLTRHSTGYLMLTGQLRSQVDAVWNAFWTGGISNPLTVIEQFTYLLFIRRLDELQTAKESQANVLGEPIEEPLFTEGEEPLRWSRFKNDAPPVMHTRFTKGVKRVDGELVTVFEHMKNVGNEAGRFSELMIGATFMISKPSVLSRVVDLIDAIDMDNRDTKGDVYEYMLSKIAAAGKNGQFRTPRHIIKLMVDMMRPTLKDTVCDPSCGTAGFLVAVSDYMREQHTEEFFDPKFSKFFHNHMLTGIEFDPTMIRIASMNLEMHGVQNPTLESYDALSEANNFRDDFTLMLANPPFKGSLDYDSVESSIGKQLKTKKTELLFNVLMLRMLKTGGRAAVIVPDGVLFGSSKAHKSLRKTLIEDHRLEAIVSMPSGVFKPYAGVSTAIVVFTKTGTGGTDNVWFYDMQSDGYSLDDKRTELETSDLPDILTRFHNRETEGARARTEQSFMVPKQEIADNDYDLSINRYKEIVYEPVEYKPVKELIAEIRELDRERGVLMEKLGV